MYFDKDKIFLHFEKQGTVEFSKKEIIKYIYIVYFNNDIVPNKKYIRNYSSMYKFFGYIQNKIQDKPFNQKTMIDWVIKNILIL